MLDRRNRSPLGMLARVFAVAALASLASPVAAQQPRFLSRADILLYGLGLRVEPAQQTVPKGIATIVSTFLQAATPPGDLPPFAPDAEVRGTLRGPSFAEPRLLVARPNSPFDIPPLTVPGTHTLEDIHLVSSGAVLMRGSPESVRIDVIEKLLVTQVTARPLTAQEIREKGIVFDKSNFQAYDFRAAFAVDEGNPIEINFSVVLPTIGGAKDVSVSTADLANVDPPSLRDLRTLIPDTLKVQTLVPNLSVTGFTLQYDAIEGSQDFWVPPIPGVIVIPGDIGFLNQYFSVMLMVGNVAPPGSRLVVTDLTASLVLPPGRDQVVGSADDPLSMAQRATGAWEQVQPVHQPGADGKLGTADDVTTLGPGETGSAEYLVEGRREGTHVLEMELAGTLTGLPVGPVPIRGRAVGAVLVRNPTFTLTFTHPDIVNAGEPYTLDVTVTNTSESPANFVTLTLDAINVSGARLVGEPARSFDEIAPSDSVTATFDLIAARTGRITAATLDADENVAGRFQLKTAVGEFGIPLSPDSLVLPKEANALPKELREAALGLLGRAWAVATAPAAAVPPELQRFSKQVVFDHAIEVAEAGFRYSLGEPLADSALHLLADVAGSNYARLSERVTKPEDLPFLQDDYEGFDLLRRKSFRGDVLAAAIARILGDPLQQVGASAFHRDLATTLTSRAPHVSVLVSAASGTLPVELRLIDPTGRQLGGGTADKITKEIPFSEYLAFVDTSGTPKAGMALVTTPEAGVFTARLVRRAGVPDDARFDVSVVVPTADGRLQVASFEDIALSQLPSLGQPESAPYRVVFEVVAEGAPAPTPVSRSLAEVPDPAPAVLAVVQMADADRVGCTNLATYQAGRVVAVLFSEEVTPESVQDRLAPEEIAAFGMTGNRAVGVALQPGRRVAYVAMRDPIGPFVPVQLTIEGATDRRGQSMGSATKPVLVTVTDEAGVVTGRVLNADGTGAPYADVRLFYEFECEAGLTEGGGQKTVTIGIAAKNADAEGRFGWNYVLKGAKRVKLVALDPTNTDEFRPVRFAVSRHGQRLDVNIVFLGRGTLRGRTFAEDGTTRLPGTQIRVTSLTDQSQFGVVTDEQGAFEIGRIPVGSILVEAVDTTRPASIFVAEDVPFAGAIVTRDLVLLDVDTTGVVVEYGALTGRVLRRDGLTPVTDVPVIAYYASRSQAGVRCPPPPGGHNEPVECAVAVVRSDANGAFAFPRVVAGSLRVYSFDQGALAEGEVRIGLPADGSFDFNLLIGGGLGKVHGVVVDRDGRPVADARVGGGLTLTAVDAQGRFTLVDMPVGRREIVAVSDAMQSTGSAHVDLVREGEEVNVTIVMEPIGGVAGIVSLHDGRPAAGITVYALQECYDTQGNAQICVAGQAVTDATGAYRIDKLLVGRYNLSAFAANMSDGNVVDVAVRYHRQVVKADITFRGGGGRVSGVVYAADGVTPLKARVAISGNRLVTAGGRVGVRFEYVQNFAVVDTDFTTGRFQFDGVWVGPFTVRAAGQFSPDPVTFQGTMPEAGAEVELVLRLQPTSRVTGTVYLPDGVTRAPAGVTVAFKSDAVIVMCSEDAFGIGTCETIPQGVQEMFAVTDAQGQFLLSPVNAGAFTLTAEHPATQRLVQVKGSVRAGEEADLNVRLLGRAPVHVLVVGSDGVTAIPGAQVSLSQIDYPRVSRQGLADASGRATFAGGDAVGEGEFVVAAVDLRNGFAGRATGRVTIDGQQVNVVVRLADATGTVSGTIYRDDGLTPVPNAEVVVSQGGHALAFAVTDANGDYSVALVPLGPFAVDVFDASTAARGYETGLLAYDGQEFVLPIRLDPLGLLKGTVVESLTLAPLKGWEVTLTQVSRSGRRLPERRTTAGVDGSFSFPGSTIGGFTLVARHRTVVGSGTASGEIARAGQVVDVPLVVTIVRRVVGTVAGTVFNPDGSPAGNAQVELCAASEPCRFSAAAANGTFSFGDVPLGRFTARAKAQLTGNVSVGLVVGDLFFEGDTAEVAITLVGLATIEGTVVDAGGSPAAQVDVALYGSPGSGCPGPCQQATDALGRFRFVDVPARTFTVVATDPLSGLRGSVGDVVGPGETRTVQVRLQPGARVTGRVLLSSGAAGKGVVVELSRGSMRLFAEADATGAFVFESVALGAITLSAQDPVGPGTARRSEILVGDFDVGDIVLDDAAPAVGSVTPAGGAIDVPLATTVRIAFTEPVTLSTALAPGAIVLTGPEGDVAGFVEVVPGSGDSALTFHPLSALRDQSRYTLRVSGVQDRVGKAMAAPHTSTFTTIDLTAPSVVEATPLAGTSGVSIASVIRVKYSETVNPAKYRGPPVTLTGPAGAVEGRTDFAFGNTTLVFTPARPVSQDATYRVDLAPATDVSGNEQPAGSSWTFTTTDGTPPVVVSLDGPGGPTSCAAPLGAKENTTVTLVAQTVPADVAFVDFFIGGVPASIDRLPPFTSSFEVTGAYGRPGDIIRVAAVATDTSGNRGSALETCVSVLADLAPAVELLAPLVGASARNGQEVAVTVKATDDLGLTQVGFAARTGRPQDAAARTLAGPALERTEHFAFVVPAGAAPGSLIVVEASARDTRGQVTTGAPVELRVLDGVAPAVTLSGFAPGARLQPGQTATVVLSAEDAGGVSSIGVSVSGAAALSQTREVAPVQPTVVSSFTFTVSPDATPADRVTIDGFATDASGNSGTAVRLVVEIADQSPPTVTLVVAGGAAATLVPGRPTTLLAEAEDDLGVARIVVSGSGAFAYSDAKTFSPPLAHAAAGFVVNAPAGLVPGSVVTVQARAVDVSGNLGQPASLTLTAVALAEVVLPPSLIVRAGESVDMQVTLAAAAPAGGLTVHFAASASGIVAVPGPVTFAEGEVSRVVAVRGLAGGSTGLSAYLAGVERATTTVSVIGGVVSGTVRDADLQGVAGAQVTVSHSGTALTTTTDASGAYDVSGVLGKTFTVRARSVERRLLGEVQGSLDVIGGSAQVDVIVLSAGTLGGRVLRADGQTVAGAGVRVDLVDAAPPRTTIATAFTGVDGSWEFDLVALGDYLVDASDTAGHLGRATAALTTEAPEVMVDIAFLARGTVAGAVRDALGGPVEGAEVRLGAISLFGAAPDRSASTGADGRFSFDEVLAGSFTVSARDPVSNLGGATAGTVSVDGAVVTADVTLAAYANLRGTVYRSDGATIAGPGVSVTVDACAPGAPSSECRFTALTDATGQYRFVFLPFRSFLVTVRDPATRGLGSASGAFTSVGETLEQDVVLLGQGTLVVMVIDADDQPVAGASVHASTTQGPLTDELSGIANAQGVVVLQRLLAGAYTVTASAPGRQETAKGDLAVDEIETLEIVLGRVRLTSISVLPPAVTLIGRGALQSLAVTGHFSDGSSQPLTSGVRFTSSQPLVAGVSPEGLVTAGNDGTATITVSAEGAAPVGVPVLVKSLVSLGVAPPNVTLVEAGQTQQLTVTGTYSDSSTVTLTSSATYQTSHAAVATVSASGLVTSTGVGVATITARYATLAPATMTVTVEARSPSGLRVQPPSLAFTAAGETAQLVVSLEFNDGTTEPLAEPAVFGSRSPLVATVSAGGLVTAIANGDGIIDVSAAGFTRAVTVSVDIPAEPGVPVITELGRAVAGEGDSLVILGRNFDGIPAANLVTISGVPAVVREADNERLVAIVPRRAVSGPVQVTVAGMASNTVNVDVYARRAEARVVSAAFDSTPAPNGEVVQLGAITLDVRAGDLVWLTGDPGTVVAPSFSGLVGPEFAGALFVRIDGVDYPINASPLPVDLTALFAEGDHDVRLRLEERSGQLRSRGVALVSGPPNTGAFIGEQFLTGDTLDRRLTVRFRFPAYADGSKVAVTAQNFNRLDGYCCTNSAGGTIIGGAPTPNDGRMRTFTVSGGEVTVTYSSEGLASSVASTRGVVIVAVPADAAGNKTTDHPVAAANLTLTGLHTASVIPSWIAELADGGRHPVPVVVESVRDLVGRAVTGTHLAVTAQNFNRLDGYCCTTSFGGVIEDGRPVSNDGRMRAFTLVDGRAEFVYSPTDLLLSVGDVRSAAIVAVPANAADQKTDDRPFALARVTLSAPTAGNAVYAVQPPSVSATSMDNRTVITIAGLSDSLGRLVPDGTKFAMTAQNFNRTDGYCCTNSAGGTLLGGAATPNDGRMRTYETTAGQIVVTYSAEGLVYGPGTIATAVVVVVPADAANNRIGDRPILAIPVKLAAVSSGTIVPEVSSVLGDGAVHPVRVTLSGLKDALGNPVPDGTRVALTASNFARLDGYCCTGSVGGEFLDGDPVPNDSRMRAYTVTGGRVEATYSPTGIELSVGDVRTAVFVAVVADAANNKRSDHPFAAGSITVSSVTGATMAASPTSLVGDTLPRQSTITITNLNDSQGRPVPDGTKVALTAVNTNRTDGYCCNGSFGGGFADGQPVPNDSRFRAFVVTGGQTQATFTAEGLFVGTDQTKPSVISLLPADQDGNRVGDRPLANVTVTMAGLAAGTFTLPASLPPLGTVVVSITTIRDVLGNAVPDGTRIALSATNFNRRDGYCCTGSAGGTFLDGVAAPNDSRFRVYVVTNGRIDATFQAPNAPNQTAVIVAVGADTSNNRREDQPFAVGSIPIAPGP